MVRSHGGSESDSGRRCSLGHRASTCHCSDQCCSDHSHRWEGCRSEPSAITTANLPSVSQGRERARHCETADPHRCGRPCERRYRDQRASAVDNRCHGCREALRVQTDPVERPSRRGADRRGDRIPPGGGANAPFATDPRSLRPPGPALRHTKVRTKSCRAYNRSPRSLSTSRRPWRMATTCKGFVSGR